VHKAIIEEGHGYIPSVTDRANTESVFLTPSVNAVRFPGIFSELLGQSLTHEERINLLTVLPTVEEMEESTEAGHELVAEGIEKSRHIVSFSVTPALKKPRCDALTGCPRFWYPTRVPKT
jgi:hypothetical protein